MPLAGTITTGVPFPLGYGLHRYPLAVTESGNSDSVACYDHDRQRHDYGTS
jgi:hypothetical protein